MPRDTNTALQLARRHDYRLDGRACLAIDANRKLRYAIEIRHESFVTAEFVELLRKHRIALVVAETAKRWPMMHDVTASFMYLRLHGDKELYKSGYSNKALDRWAARIAAWHKGGEPKDASRSSRKKPLSTKPRDIFCYFDNTDIKLRAPVDAQSLLRKLGLEPGIPPTWK